MKPAKFVIRRASPGNWTWELRSPTGRVILRRQCQTIDDAVTEVDTIRRAPLLVMAGAV